jgi:hypothetical protein
LGSYEKKAEILTAVSEWHPYRVLERELSNDRLAHIYNLIKDNEIDHLKAMIDGSGASGIAHLRFDFVEYDEEVLRLADDQTINVSELNPILLAIKYKSFACLNYLIETFGLRQSMR